MVTLGVPLKWGKSVRNDILRMCLCIYKSNRTGNVMIPKYQRDVSLSKYDFTNKIISYHTISSDDEIRNNSRLNWKISPFKGYFTFDYKGYSGFGDSLNKRLELLDFGYDDILKRSSFFLKNKAESKYKVVDSGAINNKRKVVIVGQLFDDNVARLRIINDDDLIEVAKDISSMLGVGLYYRPHPLSKGKQVNLPIDQSNFAELKKNDSIVITHNSGYGIHCVYHGIKTVFVAPNEFIDIDSNDLIRNPKSYIEESIKNFNTENYNRYFSSLLNVKDKVIISSVVSRFLNGE